MATDPSAAPLSWMHLAPVGARTKASRTWAAMHIGITLNKRGGHPCRGRPAGAVVWIFFVLGLLPMALLLWLFAGQVNEQVDSQFAGEVIALSVQRVTLTTGMRTDYLLTIRADDGRQFTLHVKDDVYALFAVRVWHRQAGRGTLAQEGGIASAGHPRMRHACIPGRRSVAEAGPFLGRPKAIRGDRR